MIYILLITIVAIIIIFIQASYIKRIKKKYKLFQVALNKTEVGVTISNTDKEDNPLIYISEGFKQITGYEVEEVLNRNCRFLQGANTDRNTVLEIREAIQAGKSIQVDLYNYKKDGTPFWNELTINPIYINHKLRHFVGIQKDVTKRKLLELELEKDLNIAKNLQKGLLSSNINDDFIKIEGYLEPSSQLAGDIYVWHDYGDGRYAVLMIDVMGHGVASGLIANSIHILARRQMLEGRTPVEAIHYVNQFMFKLFNNNIEQLYFFTGIYLLIDTNNDSVQYVNAGHMPIIHQKEDNTIQLYDSNSIPVGIDKEYNFTGGSFEFNPKDRLLLFTDGFIENSPKRYNEILENIQMSLVKYDENQNIFEFLLNQHKAMLNHEDDISLIHLYRK